MIWAQLEAHASSCEMHAQHMPYNGPTYGGDQYMDWPLGVLVHTVCPHLSPNDRHLIAMHIRSKNMANINLPTTGIGILGVPGQHTHSAIQTIIEYSLRELLEGRMRWGKGHFGKGFAHMDVYKQGDIVHLWIITGDGKSVVLEDEAQLYPSDALVTKLNMLK